MIGLLRMILTSRFDCEIVILRLFSSNMNIGIKYRYYLRKKHCKKHSKRRSLQLHKAAVGFQITFFSFCLVNLNFIAMHITTHYFKKRIYYGIGVMFIKHKMSRVSAYIIYCYQRCMKNKCFSFRFRSGILRENQTFVKCRKLL